MPNSLQGAFADALQLPDAFTGLSGCNNTLIWIVMQVRKYHICFHWRTK
jgi:hypothetical protein